MPLCQLIQREKLPNQIAAAFDRFGSRCLPVSGSKSRDCAQPRPVERYLCPVEHSILEHRCTAV
jgi:hypothetical protein